MLNWHPMFVHYPLALLTAALFFDLAARVFRARREALLRSSWYTLLLGLAGLVAAAASGLWAEGSIPHDGAVHELMELHERGMFATAALFGAAALWRWWAGRKAPGAAPLGVTALMLAGAALMAWAAHQGGRMVYEHGAGTSIPGLEMGQGHDHSAHGHGEEEAPPQKKEEDSVHIHKDGSHHQH